MKSFDTSADFAAVDAREARDLAVGRRLVLHLGPVAARVAAGLDEAARVDR